MRNLSKDVLKKLQSEKYYNLESFERDAARYIKAIKQGRMLCKIESVSKSGMSRNLCFKAPEKSKGETKYYYQNFYAFFRVLGFTPVNNSDTFRIGGCGMDMVFHTNYTIIHQLKNMGFINKITCAKLAQQTPIVI